MNTEVIERHIWEAQSGIREAEIRLRSSRLRLSIAVSNKNMLIGGDPIEAQIKLAAEYLKRQGAQLTA